MAHDIFISYSHDDKQIADALCHAVESEGIKCWIAPRDVKGGMSYAGEIMSGIEESRILVLIASKNVTESQHVLNEVNAAVSKNKIIVPFKIDDDKLNADYHYYIGKTHWIEAFPEPQKAFSKLIKTTAVLLDKSVSQAVMEYDFDKEKRAESNKNALIDKTFDERFSFGLSIANEKNKETIDEIHFYDCIKRIDIISVAERKYSSYRWLTITNKSDKPGRFIIHKECGENKVHFEALNVRAFINNYQGEKLFVEGLTDTQPNFTQIFKIHFVEPLMPGKQIKIYYRIDWPSEPASYADDNVSTSISFTRYKHGVGDLLFANIESSESSEISGIEIHGITAGFEEVDLSIPHKPYKIEEDEDMKPLHNRGYSGFYFEEKNTQYKAYRVFYKIFNDKKNNEEFF